MVQTLLMVPWMKQPNPERLEVMLGIPITVLHSKAMVYHYYYRSK